MPASDRITVVLRPAEGSSLEKISPFAEAGMSVIVGRSMAVVEAKLDGDLQALLSQAITELGREREQCLRLEEAIASDSRLPAFNLDDHVKLVADALRYRWLRNVSWDTPRQELAIRDNSNNMLIDEDLDAEIDCAMQAYPGEQENEPCAS